MRSGFSQSSLGQPAAFKYPHSGCQQSHATTLGSVLRIRREGTAERAGNLTTVWRSMLVAGFAAALIYLPNPNAAHSYPSDKCPKGTQTRFKDNTLAVRQNKHMTNGLPAEG